MRRRVVGSVMVAGMIAATGGTAVAAPVPEPQWRTPLVMDFEGALPGDVQLAGLENTGDGAARVSFVTANDAVSSFGSVDGNGYLRLPRYSGLADGAFAAVRVQSVDSDWLSPKAADFSFGADVRVDVLSEGTRIDDGDNVMQVGLYGDPAQYKLQVDNERASCVLRGDAGTVVARSSATLTPKKWYRLKCVRTGETVTLVEESLAADEPIRETVGSGELGVVDTDGAAMSVGAKVSASGKIVTGSTDQFNGRIDNVTYGFAG